MVVFMQNERKSTAEQNREDMAVEKQQVQAALVEAEGKLAQNLQVFIFLLHLPVFKL